MGQPGDDLILQFSQSDTGAFTVIFNKYHPTVYYFVKKWVREREDAEDITAQVFAKLWRKRRSFTSVKNVQAFLYTVARNACIDFLRQRKRQQEQQGHLLARLEQEPKEGIIQDDLQTEILRHIYQEIEKLPVHCRKVFKMSYLDGLSNPEIAKALRINLQSVYNHKQRAIKLLRIAFLRRGNLMPLIFFCCYTALRVLP